MPGPAPGPTKNLPNTNNPTATTRTTFRPPWVKEVPPATPTPTAPWIGKKLNPVHPAESNAKENGPSRSPVRAQESKVIPIQVQREDTNSRPKLVNQKAVNVERMEPTPTKVTRQNSGGKKVIAPSPPAPPAPPAPPKAPPMAPPPPPGMDGAPSKLTDKQRARIEGLKQRPRRRPDYAEMMKEVEAGKKLRHVVCNDRSAPILPGKAKTRDGKFLYDSEKPNVHNELLKQIQSGVKLKTVQTNDRSKPILDGLRKFRRQMTIEEQIIKSQSIAQMSEAGVDIAEIEDAIVDEMDDIDKVRDDLQSTKQLLALELRTKEASAREKKQLQSRIENLERQLEVEKGRAAAAATRSVLAERMTDDVLINNLKKEADDARKTAKEAEKKYLQATDQLDTTKGELEEQRRRNEMLEKRLDAALKMLKGEIRRQSTLVGDADDGEKEQTETESSTEESSEDEEETEEKIDKRQKREIKLLTNRLNNFKDKEETMKKDRASLKAQMKKQQNLIREEKIVYKKLQKQVDKMAALMASDGDEDDGGNALLNCKTKDLEVGDDEIDDDEEEEESDSDVSESDSSSGSDEDDEDDVKSQSEPEDAPFDKRKENYTQRSRRHESRLAALKKGNYLLKANIDRLIDDLNKQRELTTALRHDLDSVISDLG